MAFTQTLLSWPTHWIWMQLLILYYHGKDMINRCFNNILFLSKSQLKQTSYFLTLCYIILLMREKCPNTKFFLVRIFPHSNWIRRFTPNAGKNGPKKTPYLDTFHAMYTFVIALYVSTIYGQLLNPLAFFFQPKNSRTKQN